MQKYFKFIKKKHFNVVDLVVVLHELDDDPDVVAVVLDGDDPHDVGRVLRVGVGAVLVSQHQARVSLVNLRSAPYNPLNIITMI